MMDADSGTRFWQASFIDPLSPTDQHKGAEEPAAEWPVTEGHATYDLPDARDFVPGNNSFTSLVNRRRSVRTYAPDALSVEELAFLLWATQGVEKRMSGGKTRRTSPSAGARHALETLLMLNRVHNFSRGLYRYIPSRHALEEVSCDQGFFDDLVGGFRNVSLVNGSAVTFMWVSDTYRMTWKFGMRGYRYLLLDAGHICENLYLAAESLSCGCCAIGAFDDDELNRLLACDGVSSFLVYGASVGRKTGGE